MRVVAAMLVLALTGCATSQRSASVSRTTGTQGGQPVDLFTVSRAEAEAKTQADLGPMVSAAVAAAMGDVRGALKSLAERPAAPTAGEIEKLVEEHLKSAPSAQDLERLLAGKLAEQPRPPSAQEVAREVKAIGAGEGMDPETSAALGGAAGLLLLALREFLAHRKTQKDEAEGWAEALKLAKALPPERAP